jgi:hypothetical protein
MGASGCSVGNYGVIAARVVNADGALVVDVYSVGVNLRTRVDDPGITVGASRRSYIFAPDRADLDEGWHYLRVSMPDRPSVAQETESIGFDVRSGSPGLSFDLGYSETAVLARADRGSSLTMQIDYQPAQPSLTRLRYCEGNDRC